jgi:hypothetical protein
MAAAGWPAGSSISVQLHYQRTGHANYEGRYVDGRGLQLHCTTCHARIHVAQPETETGPTSTGPLVDYPDRIAVTLSPPDNPDYPRRTRVNPDRWPYV